MAKKYDFDSNFKFINPYNFVPLGGEVARNAIGDNREVINGQDEMLYGRMRCCGFLRHPLAIPDTDTNHVRSEKTNKNEEHKVYRFMRIGDKPVVPASELRGVIRNVYETITNSCFGTVKADTHLTARVLQTFKPGLLFCNDDKWELWSAERFLVVVDEKERFLESHRDEFEEAFDGKKWPKTKKRSSGEELDLTVGQSVYAKLSNNSYKKKSKDGSYRPIAKYVDDISLKECHGSDQVYVVAGETIPRRHFESLFKKKKIQDFSDSTIRKSLQGLDEIVKIYRNDAINAKYDKEHHGYKWYEETKCSAKAGKGALPIYYSINEDGTLYLSFAALGRKAFSNTLNSLLGDHAPEKCSRIGMCPACSLFGTIKNEGIGSRVRFTDGYFDGEISMQEGVVFPELGMPKPSYFPFYLDSDKGKFKNGYDDPSAVIRGRKYYWHHSPISEKDKGKRNASFEIMKSGCFSFDIFFDGITRQQLDQLCTSIHFNENDKDGVRCHKVGHGKPVGYGSVKLIVESIYVRDWEKKSGWKEKRLDIPTEDTGFLCDAKIWDSILEIVNIDSCKEGNVRYPFVVLNEKHSDFKGKLKENVLASHQWFKLNYGLGKDDAEHRLPQIGEVKELNAITTAYIDEMRDIDQRFSNSGTRDNKAVKDAPICANDGCNKRVTTNKYGKWFTYCYECAKKMNKNKH